MPRTLLFFLVLLTAGFVDGPPLSGFLAQRVVADEPDRAAVVDEVAQPPAGTLFISGGGVRHDNADVWKRLVQLAADYAERTGVPPGTPPRIAVFATGSLFPQRSGERIAEVLRTFGADPVIVPVGLQNLPINYREAVADPKIVAEIKEVHGVYFGGGQQARIIKALLEDDDSRTPVLEAIWSVYRAGGVVGGTSAGAAVMSHVMCLGADKQLPLLERGVIEGVETARGLAFMPEGWFIDQHFLTRGRVARALVIMQNHGVKYGLGIDENTAIVVQNGQVEVTGYSGAMLIDLSEAERLGEEKEFHLHKARLSFLAHGDRLDLATREVIPSPEKQDLKPIDPGSPDFQPFYQDPIVSNDILGNNAVLDVMRKLMDSRHPEATGLTFDGLKAQQGPTLGFVFRLYRDQDTKGWPPGALGDDLTITNLRLDVRPVEIHGPLYK
ncbi:MAG: cyanophycinase [Planctomycetales bacterium]